MREIHSLLNRQLKRFYGNVSEIPEIKPDFLEAVNSAYKQADADRKLLERSLELSSQELLQTNADLRAVFQAFPDLFFWMDKSGTILDCKGGMAVDMWLPAEKLIGKKIQNIPMTDIGQKLQEAIDSVVIKNELVMIEYIISQPDNADQFFETRLLPLLKDRILMIVRNITDRKKAETALKNSEERYRQVNNSIEDIIFSLNPAGVIQFISGACEKMIGVSSEKLIGKNIIEAAASVDLDPDQLQKLMNIYRDGRKRRDGFLKYEIINKWQGKVLYLEINQSVIYTDNGDVINTVGVVRDITDRKQVEIALRESEERFRNIFENAVVGMYRTTPGGRVLMANPALIKMLGYQSIEDLSDFNVTAQGYLEKKHHSRFVNEIEKKGQVSGLESAWKRLDGTVLYVRESARAIYDESGNILYYEGIVEDVTERKEAERALKESEEKIQKIASAAMDAIIMVNHFGKITYWNRAAETIFGYTLREVMNHSLLATIIPPQSAFCFRKGFESFSKTGKGSIVGKTIEMIAMNKERIEFPIEMSLSKVKVNNQWNAISIVRDITKRKKVETQLKMYRENLENMVKERTDRLNEINAQLKKEIQERTKTQESLKNHVQLLEAANKELESFSYSVSHDLRAPLRAIDGYANIILEDYQTELGSDAVRYLQLISQSTKQLGKLVDDLLAFTRMGRQEIGCSQLNMKKLVQDAFQEIKTYYPDKEIRFVIRDIPRARGDRTMLKQVFMNLLINAIKFSSKMKRTKIVIGGYQQNHENVYFVKDNGVGFDMKYVHKLFGVFQRLHHLDEFEGTGIGLALVQRIIHRHGGRVWAEGEVNKGAMFYFSLPESK